MKDAGLEISEEIKAREHLRASQDCCLGILALSRQGKHLGITFSSDLQHFNGPALKKALFDAGFTQVQFDQFLANTQIRYVG